MSLKITALRPSLLVSFKTTMRGNVKYTKTTLEAERTLSTGEKEAMWQTQRIITDPEEFERGRKARGDAFTAVRRICSWSSFGLLCPESNADVLAEAITEARKIASEFNSSATTTQLSVYVMVGNIAANDVEAGKAIGSEVRELIEAMEAGVANGDVKAIREAANKARGLSQMLTPENETRLKMALDAARGVARDITKANKDGTAVTVDRVALRRLGESRAAFLDFDDESAEIATAAPAAERVVELDEPAGA